MRLARGVILFFGLSVSGMVAAWDKPAERINSVNIDCKVLVNVNGQGGRAHGVFGDGVKKDGGRCVPLGAQLAGDSKTVRGVPTKASNEKKPDESSDSQLALVLGFLIAVLPPILFMATPNAM